MLEDLLAVGQMNKEHQVARKRSTCMEPYYNTKNIEDSTAPSYVEEKAKYTRENIHHLAVQ